MNHLLLLQAANAETIAVAANEAAQVQETSYFKLVFALNSLWIMIPLFLMLGFAIYLFVKKLLVLNRASTEEYNFMNNIRDFIHDGKLESAVALCKGNDNPSARLIEKGLSRIGRPLDDIRTAVENEGNIEVGRLEKGVSASATPVPPRAPPTNRPSEPSASPSPAKANPPTRKPSSIPTSPAPPSET